MPESEPFSKPVPAMFRRFGWTNECCKLKELYDPYRHWSLCDDGAGTVSHCGSDRAASYKASRFDRKAEGKS